ncbi:ABC transporter substrate-binding protein [Oceanibaculum pacificum]|uniref:ABC transporter substrate-binding protein n=1 Tax=Oceanibaculum pacificum TaxID=580166 RepID=A0A154W503_9PROT|nr:ABC transporter substrate-binding protein [Oceanibaculum pacificum]KZD08559.1 ABC transporter substrate-binding protein [Oceanibaculum pacificum]
MKRRDFLKAGTATAIGAGMLPFLKVLPASAAVADTLVVVTGTTINSLDLHRTGTNRPSYQVSVNCYDRLLTFGTKTMPDGTLSYDYSKLEGELAESWEIAPDGNSVTFKLKDATFWDGSPVTAEDVKWSLDRAVTVGGFPTVQMKAGSLEKPEQFEVIDAKTFKINFLRQSKLTLPDLAVPVPFIINSKLAKKNATEKDPWAMEYLHRTPAGSGAYKVERWDSGQQLVYSRNDAWKGGPLPAAKRIIVREIPSQSTRRALIERGDVHLSHDIPAKDAKELAAMKSVKVVGAPIENCLHVLCTNFNFEPFKDKKVRQAVAYAVPYAEIFQNAAYERGAQMWGGKSFEPSDISWPQPFPYTTDYDKAKELLSQTAFKDGFEVPLSFDLGTAEWGEPTALLIQEGLAKIGIKASIDKIPGANWRTVALVEKKLPLHLDNFGGWLNTPDYYFFWAYVKGNLFNSSNYDDAEMMQLVNETLHMPMDNPDYAPKIKRMIAKAFEEVPRIPLYQPNLDVAMRPGVEGYEAWFHRMPDVRTLTFKTA